MNTVETPAPAPAKVAILRDLIARGHSAEAILEEFKRVAVLHGLPPEVGAASFRGCLGAAVEDLESKRQPAFPSKAAVKN